MHTITEVKEDLTGMLHGGTLNRVRNFESALRRAANTQIAKADFIETERITPLSQVVHNDVYNYALASDYHKLIDLRPQDDRRSPDRAQRNYAESFDAEKLIKQKRISIEGAEGTKFIRINWRSRSGKTVDGMNETTGWGLVSGATNLETDKLFKITGSASLRFDLDSSGGGLEKTTISTIDATDEDEQGDFFMWLFFNSVSDLTSITGIWGNDLTTNFWTSVAQTKQADDTAFKAGWNLIKFPWSTATESGTVDPSAIDSFRFTIAASAAIPNVRADNIILSLGRNFDIKYYSQFAFKNTAGTFIDRPTSDNDVVVFGGTSYQIFLLESLKACAHQIEGEDSAFDVNYAKLELNGDPRSPDPMQRKGLYAKYRTEFPSQAMKATSRWSNPRSPNFKNRFTRLGR